LRLQQLCERLVDQLVFPAHGEWVAVVLRVTSTDPSWRGVVWRAPNRLKCTTAAGLVHFLLHARELSFEKALFKVEGGNEPGGALNPAIPDLLSTMRRRPFRLRVEEVGALDCYRYPFADQFPTRVEVATAGQFINFRHISAELRDGPFSHAFFPRILSQATIGVHESESLKFRLLHTHCMGAIASLGAVVWVSAGRASHKSTPFVHDVNCVSLQRFLFHKDDANSATTTTLPREVILEFPYCEVGALAQSLRALPLWAMRDGALMSSTEGRVTSIVTTGSRTSTRRRNSPYRCR